MSQDQCPKCQSSNVYQDRDLYICPECSFEWTKPNVLEENVEANDESVVKDMNGNILRDGDSVIVAKELKIRGASGAIKSGTKVKNIKIIEPIDGHDISCKVEGVGAINLKSEFVRKA